MTLQEALSWLTQRADATGECDRCHKEPVAVWQLPMEIDREPDAHWMYCRECFRAVVTAYRKRFKG